MKHRVSEALLRDEVERIKADTSETGWEISTDYEKLQLTVKLTAQDDEEYTIRFDCTDYDQAPPKIDMLDPETKERNTSRAFFDDSGYDQYILYPGGPGVCHPINRHFYLEMEDVHPDWNPKTISNWRSLASPHDTIHAFIRLVDKRLFDDRYKGRHQA